MRDYVFLSRSAGTLRTHVWQNLADTFWAETLTLFVSLADFADEMMCFDALTLDLFDLYFHLVSSTLGWATD